MEGLPSLRELAEVPRASLAALLLSNLVPLAGVVLFGWDLGTLLLLYWAESAVILAFSLLKLAIVAGRAAVALVPFFLVHAGMFMGGHLVFLLVLFVDRPDAGWGALARDVAIGVAAFVASHGVSFMVNFRRRGETYKLPQSVMLGFYGRIVVMHLTILFGAMLAAIIGHAVAALILLIVLKTAADAVAHLRERRKHAPGPTDADGVAAPPTPS